MLKEFKVHSSSAISSEDEEESEEVEELEEEGDEEGENDEISEVESLDEESNDRQASDSHDQLGDNEIVSSAEDSEQSDTDTHASGSETDNDSDAEPTNFTTQDQFIKHFEKTLDDNHVDDLKTVKPQRSQISMDSIGDLLTTYRVKELLPEETDTTLSFESLHVKQVIRSECRKANKRFAGVKRKKLEVPLNTQQQSLFRLLNTYQDLYYCRRDCGPSGEPIRFVYCLHALNHVLKTRTKIIKHNEKLKNMKDAVEVPDSFRDQGFTRPKVVIVVPFRDSAVRVVKILGGLLMPDDQSFVSNKKRFLNEYESKTDDHVKGKKPDDYQQTFVGNIDDHFRIGLSVARKSLKLYTEFYSSDIIIASPLGLKSLEQEESSTEKSDDCGKYDFLSSIEMLIIDQADVLLMQNWDHVLNILQQLHSPLAQTRDTDFMRIRSWALNDWYPFYRQTLLFSAFQDPMFSALFNKHCKNYAGLNQLLPAATPGSVCQVLSKTKQVFLRVECDSPLDASHARQEYFLRKVLHQIQEPSMRGSVVFVADTLEFVKLRKALKAEEINFIAVDEYSEERHLHKARTLLYHRKVQLVVFTMRFHYYHRYRIRGITHLFFYGLPHYAHMYAELCNLLEGSNSSITVLYTRYDAQALGRVAGERAREMLQSVKSKHMIVTGS